MTSRLAFSFIIAFFFTAAAVASHDAGEPRPQVQGEDPALALAKTLAFAVRNQFDSPNKRGLTPTAFIGDMTFAIRRQAGLLTLKEPLNLASPVAMFKVGWAAGSSWIGRPRANCGELAAAVHTAIIFDKLQGGDKLAGRVTHWRIVMEKGRDHAWDMVKIARHWFKVDAWAGTAEPLPVNSEDLPRDVEVFASPVYFFRNNN